MKRRLIAAAIFLGILFLLLWFAGAQRQRGYSARKARAFEDVCKTMHYGRVKQIASSKKEDSSDEVTFDPQYVNWHRPPMTAAPLGFLLGWFSFPIYFACLRRGAPQPL